MLTETELDKLDDSFTIPGYKIYYASPSSHGRIRVLVLLRDSLNLSSPPTLLAVTHQEIWLKIPCAAAGSWTLAAVYRQWSGSEAADLDLLCANVKNFYMSSPRIVLIGDLNFDVARMTDPTYYRRPLMLKFMAVMEELGFRLENDLTPTYRSHGAFGVDKLHRESVLDLVLTLGVVQSLPVRVLQDTVTDHHPISVSLPVHKTPSGMKVLLRRNFKRVSQADLIMHINAGALSAVFGEEDVDKITEIIVREVTKVLDVLAPLERILVKESLSPLSLRRETRRLMQERDLAASRKDWPLFRKLRNQAARHVRQDRLHSNLDLLNRCRGDTKQVWQLANSLTGRNASNAPPPCLEWDGQLVQGGDKLADVMNRFFIGKVERIRAGIDREKQQQQQQQQWQQQHGPPPLPAHLPCSAPSSSSSSSFQLRPPSESDVIKAINRLKNTPALGEDGIPTRILKDLAPVLAPLLAHLARRSFQSSKVPALFKVANVVPVLKKGKNAASPSSYRPIALLTTMSKVLERLVLQQFSPHLDKGLPPAQWGFRKNRGTAAALATAQGHWAWLRAAGAVIGVAAFDYSSAFDTLGMRELVSKLEVLNVGPKARLWFEDYLGGRKQRVRLGTASSGLRGISFGVPQGSLLGPTLFIALTSDLPAALDLDKDWEGISIYADDCCIWTAHKSQERARIRLEELSSKLAEYSLVNSLSLNPGKTQVMWIGGSASPPPTNIGGTLVAPSDTLQLLGLSFDRRLTLTPHFRTLVEVAGSLQALARRLLVHLPRGRYVEEVVCSLVIGRLCYGSALFPLRLDNEDPNCQLLQTIQVRVNDTARLLLGAARADRIPTEELLSRTGLPSLNRNAIRATVLELWKALNSGDGPEGGRNPLGMILSSPPLSRPTCCTRSAKAGNLPPPSAQKRQCLYMERCQNLQ